MVIILEHGQKKHGKLPYITYEKEEQEEVKQYKIIVDKIPVYTNANNAKNHKKSTGTWGKGIYYIFNEAYGMINITTKVGTAGAWINPADNVIKEEPPKVDEPIEEEKPPIVEEIPKDDEDNTEKEPIIEEKPNEPIDTPNEETNENEQPNEEIGQELEETTKENVFVKLIKIIFDFIIGIFKR